MYVWVYTQSYAFTHAGIYVCVCVYLLSSHHPGPWLQSPSLQVKKVTWGRGESVIARKERGAEPAGQPVSFWLCLTPSFLHKMSNPLLIPSTSWSVLIIGLCGGAGGLVGGGEFQLLQL